MLVNGTDAQSTGGCDGKVSKKATKESEFAGHRIDGRPGPQEKGKGLVVRRDRPVKGARAHVLIFSKERIESVL